MRYLSLVGLFALLIGSYPTITQAADLRITNADFTLQTAAYIKNGKKRDYISCVRPAGKRLKLGILYTKRGRKYAKDFSTRSKITLNKRLVKRLEVLQLCYLLTTASSSASSNPPANGSSESSLNASSSSFGESSSLSSSVGSTDTSGSADSSAANNSSQSSLVSSDASVSSQTSSPSSSSVTVSSSSYSSSGSLSSAASSSGQSESRSSSVSSSSSANNSSSMSSAESSGSLTSSSSANSSSSSSSAVSSGGSSSSSSSSSSSDPCGMQADGYQGICTATQLDQVRTNPNGNYRLMNNIDLKGINWVPIPSRASDGNFNGIFDGNNKKIFNLQGDANNTALFFRNKGTIKDFVISGININAEEYAAGLAIVNSGLIHSVMTVGSISVTKGSVGGLVVSNSGYGTIEDSTAVVSISRIYTGYSGTNFGGLVGQNTGLIQRSASHGSITITGSAANIGGLVGWAYHNSIPGEINTISSTLSDVQIDARGNPLLGQTANVGGLVGGYFSNPVQIRNSSAHGNIRGDFWVGGLVGRTTGVGPWNELGSELSKNVISGCVATGNVSGAKYLGGLVGGMLGGDLLITKSSAHGNVTALPGITNHCTVLNNKPYYCAFAVGGLVGQAFSATIERSFYSGNLDTTQDILANTGGLVGWFGNGADKSTTSALLRDSFAQGNVTSGSSHILQYSTAQYGEINYALGGVVGLMTGPDPLSDPNNVRIERTYHGAGRIFNPTAPATARGVVGERYYGAASNFSVDDCYWDISTSPDISSPLGGYGKTTEEMRQAATFNGWDFSATGPWKILEGVDYPTLK